MDKKQRTGRSEGAMLGPGEAEESFGVGDASPPAAEAQVGPHTSAAQVAALHGCSSPK